jgi:hypothetical protein
LPTGALELVADHAGASADIALGDKKAPLATANPRHFAPLPDLEIIECRSSAV